MNTDLIVRKALKDDLSAILHLYAQDEIDNGSTLTIEEAEIIYDRMSRYPNYAVYVAEKEYSIVGTFALLIMDNLGHLGAPSAIVEDVAVEPSLHRRGIGRCMMEHAAFLARKHKCYKLTLSTDLKRNKAHAFYESLGFVKHGYSFRMDLV